MINEAKSDYASELYSKIEARTVSVAILGLGYVGLPLALAYSEAGINVTGYDIDESKIEILKNGGSYLKTVSSERVSAAVDSGVFSVSTTIDCVRSVDAIIICVPTPLNIYREPDLSYIVNTVDAIIPHLRLGQILSLESTTYPGTTEEVICDKITKNGYNISEDFFVVYSPEREDPGNISFSTSTIPKIVGGYASRDLQLGINLYSLIISEVVPAGTLKTAEAIKLTENVFRAVNIALVNELKITFEKMDIDIWEVIEGAKTKPFGFMPFYPGPGLGGHCIPIDPFYLTWKAREYGISTRFIELAGEINNSMPNYVISKLAEGMDLHLSKGLNKAKVLLVGMAYKKNVDDTRESPALKILEVLHERQSAVAYYDPYVKVLPKLRKYPAFKGLKSLSFDEVTQQNFDAAVICTDHDNIDYEKILSTSTIVVDTRNTLRNTNLQHVNIIKA